METNKIENRYFDLIDKCHNELDLLVKKVDMITDGGLKAESCSETTPSFTDLERRLNNLFLRIKSLKEDIII